MTLLHAEPAPRSIPMAELCQRALGTGGFTSKPILGVTDDSRKVRPGWLFVAVPGLNTDGHAFVPQAISAGAAAIVVERPVGTPAGVIELMVPDSQHALARLMACWTGLDQLQTAGRLRVAGITGTNGKSTFGFMMRGLLQAAGFPTALIGTIIYDLIGRQFQPSEHHTTPPAADLCRYLAEACRAGARFAVMEVSSHALAQRRTDGIEFDVAAFSNLTGDHLDYHGTMAGYFQAKKRLFDGLSSGATAVINADDPQADAIVADCKARILRYGLNDRADLRAQIVESNSRGTRFVLQYRGGSMEVMTPLAGRHNVYNALAACGTALALGLDLETIRTGLPGVHRVPGRLERVEVEGSGLDVFVDYAHTDDALENVLRALRPLTIGKLWCVFGCGGDRDPTKRPRMAAVTGKLADKIVITSDNPRTEDAGAIISQIETGLPATARSTTQIEPDRAAAIHSCIRQASPGDTILIAGKGHENYQIIGTTEIPFDDVKVAAAALRRRAGAE